MSTTTRKVPGRAGMLAAFGVLALLALGAALEARDGVATDGDRGAGVVEATRPSMAARLQLGGPVAERSGPAAEAMVQEREGDAARWIASVLLAALAVATAVLVAQSLRRAALTLRARADHSPVADRGDGLPPELAALVVEVRRHDTRSGVSDEYRGVIW